MTLTYSGCDEGARNRLLAHLAENGDEMLRDRGFELIRDALPVDGPQFNKYHVYSKQVPLNFSNPEQTVTGLRQGIESLLQLEAALDQFDG